MRATSLSLKRLASISRRKPIRSAANTLPSEFVSACRARNRDTTVRPHRQDARGAARSQMSCRRRITSVQSSARNNGGVERATGAAIGHQVGNHGDAGGAKRYRIIAMMMSGRPRGSIAPVADQNGRAARVQISPALLSPRGARAAGLRGGPVPHQDPASTANAAAALRPASWAEGYRRMNRTGVGRMRSRVCIRGYPISCRSTRIYENWLNPTAACAMGRSASRLWPRC